jgi:hypothetical protein
MRYARLTTKDSEATDAVRRSSKQQQAAAAEESNKITLPRTVHVCNMNSKYEYNVSHQNNNEPMRPNSVGTIHNLPDDVRTMAGLQHPDAATADVVVWTKFDTEFEHTMTPSVLCCRIVWIAVLLPCICPCVTIMSPCLYTKARAQQHAMRNTYWILTDRDVKIVVLANSVLSIPFCDIINCYVPEPSSNKIFMPALFIDTASSLASLPASVDRRSSEIILRRFHAAAGMGLLDYNWFRTEILRRRDHLMMELPTVPAASAMVEATFVVEPACTMVEATCVVEPTTAMDRGSTTTNSNESIERRIQIIVDLHQRGIVTKEEYEMKRQEIIASI